MMGVDNGWREEHYMSARHVMYDAILCTRLAIPRTLETILNF